MNNVFNELKSPFPDSLMQMTHHNVRLYEKSDGHLWLEGHFAGSANDLETAETIIYTFNNRTWSKLPDSARKPSKKLKFVGQLSNGRYYLFDKGLCVYNNGLFIDLSDSVNAKADFRQLDRASIYRTKTDISNEGYLYIRARGKGLFTFNGESETSVILPNINFCKMGSTS